MHLQPLRETLQEIAVNLALPADRFRLLGPYEYRPVLEEIAERFLNVGKRGVSYQWWWENLKGESESLQTEAPYKLLPKLLPQRKRLWFLAHDSGKKHGALWVYEADAEAIFQVLESSFGFEYYIVPKRYEWLLCETHHDILVAVGAPMIEALSRVKASA
jgi:hypothetical protein